MADKASGSNNMVKIAVAALGCIGIVVPATLSYLGQSKPPAHTAPHKKGAAKEKVRPTRPSTPTFLGQPTDHFNTNSLIPRGYENLSVGMTVQQAGDLDLLDIDSEADHVGFNVKPPVPFTDGACLFDPNHEVVDRLRFDLAAGSYDAVKNEMVTAFGQSRIDDEDNLTWKVGGLVGVLSDNWLMISKPRS